MDTRVIRIPAPAAPERAGVSRLLGPAGKALLVAVSASVLVASLSLASPSTDHGQVRALMAGTQPEPAPPPTLATAAPDGAAAGASGQ
jgi:hypothetical protein